MHGTLFSCKIHYGFDIFFGAKMKIFHLKIMVLFHGFFSGSLFMRKIYLFNIKIQQPPVVVRLVIIKVIHSVMDFRKIYQLETNIELNERN
ncbi:hypothetical protein DERP_012272 [Dermatophagoides pteronyssinus]|uniref:Uncharacterized protein n=1 Tax=Dermatophagoides pteronyssinus TaxID=6956 RepID=A0ABQ8JG09_DERPT|nr:hypothetical protein DERP_012272 [Dermatophagoides pteronyssinus]